MSNGLQKSVLMSDGLGGDFNVYWSGEIISMSDGLGKSF